MNEFIEVNQGVFVKASSIEGFIEVSDENNPEILSKILTSRNSYLSVLPVSAINEIISVMSEPSPTNKDDWKEKFGNILKQHQTFAG